MLVEVAPNSYINIDDVSDINVKTLQKTTQEGKPIHLYCVYFRMKGAVTDMDRKVRVATFTEEAARSEFVAWLFSELMKKDKLMRPRAGLLTKKAPEVLELFWGDGTTKINQIKRQSVKAVSERWLQEVANLQANKQSVPTNVDLINNEALKTQARARRARNRGQKKVYGSDEATIRYNRRLGDGVIAPATTKKVMTSISDFEDEAAIAAAKLIHKRSMVSKPGEKLEYNAPDPDLLKDIE